MEHKPDTQVYRHLFTAELLLRAKTHTVNNVHTNSYPFSIFMAYAFICEILCVWIPSPYQHLGKGKKRERGREKAEEGKAESICTPITPLLEKPEPQTHHW